MSEHHSTVKEVVDMVSVFAAIGSFLEMLTPVFGLIGAIWTLMRIAEMVTGKEFHEIIRCRKTEDAEHQ